MGFWKCMIHFAVTGVCGFVVGRILPKDWFQADLFPYASYPFEQDGCIYRHIGIHKWHNKVPDMSRIFPKRMPAKKLNGQVSPAQLLVMIQETCVAEMIHGILMLTGFGCVHLWSGSGGWILALVNALLGNLPFVLIQRYNRPRLNRLYRRKLQEVAC